MIPGAWVAAVLALAVYRLCRLAGWDDFPLAVRARFWLAGGVPGLPFRRPWVWHLLTCPFCVGWWISLAVYLAWLEEPRWTLYALFPLALSGAAGLVAKNLDS